MPRQGDTVAWWHLKDPIPETQHQEMELQTTVGFTVNRVEREPVETVRNRQAAWRGGV